MQLKTTTMKNTALQIKKKKKKKKNYNHQQKERSKYIGDQPLQQTITAFLKQTTVSHAIS